MTSDKDISPLKAFRVLVVDTAQIERISIYPGDLPAGKKDRLFEALKKLNVHYSYEAY